MSNFVAARHLLQPIELVQEAIRPGHINFEFIWERYGMLSSGEKILVELAQSIYFDTRGGPSLAEARCGLDDVMWQRVCDALAIARKGAPLADRQDIDREGSITTSYGSGGGGPLDGGAATPNRAGGRG